MSRTSTPTGTRTSEGRASRPRMTTRRLLVIGVLVSLFLAGVVSFYASSHPDGLESVAGDKGFLGSAGPHAGDDSPFAGYATRGVDNARLSGGIAGVVGATLVFVLAGGLFLAVRRRDLAGRRRDLAVRRRDRDGDARGPGDPSGLGDPRDRDGSPRDDTAADFSRDA